MASSRKSKRSKPASTGLLTHVRATVLSVIRPGDRLLVGLSGGIDSVVLLDLLARLAPRLGFELEALHVNHQLSPNAARWARFCRALCSDRGVRCRVVKVDVASGNSVERAARDARYAALERVRADHVVLAHNRDDQAETVLLQLLRGAGVRGLAAMPVVRRARDTSVLRPLLAVARAQIEQYAKRHKLDWIDDESNTDTRYTRNWLRRDVLPRIEERIPSYRDALARAAQNLGEAASLLDDLARLDAERARTGEAIRLDVLESLGPARAKNLLRFLIAERGWRMPDSARLEEALRQGFAAGADRTPAVRLGDCELRRHAGLIHLVPAVAVAVAAHTVTWRGESEIALPGGGGVLVMVRGHGDGLSVARLEGREVTVRARIGGERLQPHANRPRRTVKNLLQEARLPTWQREKLPFIYCGDHLACVPGVAIDCRYRAQPGEPSLCASWREARAAAPARSKRRPRD